MALHLASLRDLNCYGHRLIPSVFSDWSRERQSWHRLLGSKCRAWYDVDSRLGAVDAQKKIARAAGSAWLIELTYAHAPRRILRGAPFGLKLAIVAQEALYRRK